MLKLTIWTKFEKIFQKFNAPIKKQVLAFKRWDKNPIIHKNKRAKAAICFYDAAFGFLWCGGFQD